MDPTTTLVTFMLHSFPKTHSISLVGSWDNFTRRYPMERDVRKGQGEWRGVHSFKDITCDGDVARIPKRNGGLKMGKTYWYYYELNDGTEIHNTAVPSTTSCPYLPGQPVNVMDVPTQVNPLRERSASESAMAGGAKTMNPSDKFLSPRPPPAVPRPQLARLNSSPAAIDTGRSPRSASPSGPRSPWSAKGLFGLRAALSVASNAQDRGRTGSPIDGDFKQANSIPRSNLNEGRVSRTNLTGRAIPGTMSSRDASPSSLRRVPSREPSPLRHPVILETSTIVIPDDITEEELEDDDANFATAADIESTGITSLSPPPTKQALRLRTPTPDMKPLPKLPHELSPALVASPSMIPEPLNLAPPPNSLAPRSHFSIDTVSTGLVSPTESYFSSVPSIYDDEEDGDAAIDDSFTHNSAAIEASSPGGGPTSAFQYSLPGDRFGSESTLTKDNEAANVAAEEVAVRDPYASQDKMSDTVSALDDLLAEMGYLGGIIVGK